MSGLGFMFVSVVTISSCVLGLISFLFSFLVLFKLECKLKFVCRAFSEYGYVWWILGKNFICEIASVVITCPFLSMECALGWAERFSLIECKELEADC